MAYDEHYQGGAPGPIAGCRWVRASLEVALRSVPPGRLELGEAGYGYRWFPGRLGATAQVSDRQARSLAAAHGVRPRWISSACEWRAVLPDHSIIWWSDRRAQQLDTALAHARKLAGVAVWALDLSDPL